MTFSHVKQNSLLLMVLILLCWKQAYALAPLESLILGDYSAQYFEEKSDPLNYLFRFDKVSGQDKERQFLANYRGFIEEGENLLNYCKGRPEVQYASSWDLDQVVRATMATMQYIGLDITSRALAKYAQHFEFTSKEYENLIENLTGNFCSKNMTIISLGQLKKNMSVKFNMDNSFQLPSIEDNSLFAGGMRDFNTKDDYLKQEFWHTIRLFKSFCSWGNSSDDFRLLVPLVRDPIVMAFVMRQMSNQKVVWRPVDNSFVMQKELNTVQVVCQDLICRKKDATEFHKEFPRAIGSHSLLNDLKRVYCAQLRDADYNYQERDAKLKKIIESQSLDDERFLISQFIALLTGVPDFLLRAEKFADAHDFVRASMDQVFTQWAQARNEEFSRDIYYEESLTVEKVERELYFNKYRAEFKVVFDVNLGEFDRLNQTTGKLKTSFAIKLPKNYLRWMRRRWITLDPRDKKEGQRIVKDFKKYIAKEVSVARSRFKFPPWSGDLEHLIVKELLEQLNLYRGDYFAQADNSIIAIPIELNFAPFALKYTRYKFQINRALEKARKERSTEK